MPSHSDQVRYPRPFAAHGKRLQIAFAWETPALLSCAGPGEAFENSPTVIHRLPTGFSPQATASSVSFGVGCQYVVGSRVKIYVEIVNLR